MKINGRKNNIKKLVFHEQSENDNVKKNLETGRSITTLRGG
jgi:hypothetical protein